MPDQNNPNDPQGNLGTNTSSSTTPDLVATPLTQDNLTPTMSVDTAPDQPTPPPPPSLGVDVPPLPLETADKQQDGQAETLPAEEPKQEEPTTPSPEGIITTSGKPKKKGRGRIVATILGILLLVGGIGAGIVLVQQQQDIRERASGQKCSSFSVPICEGRSVGADCSSSNSFGLTASCKTTGSVGNDGLPSCGCSTQSENGDTTSTTNGNTGRSCTADSDCNTNEVCFEGGCWDQGGTSCIVNGGCLEGIKDVCCSLSPGVADSTCRTPVGKRCGSGGTSTPKEGGGGGGSSTGNCSSESDSACVGKGTRDSCGTNKDCRKDSTKTGSDGKAICRCRVIQQPPPSGGISAQCLNIIALDEEGNQLSSEDLVNSQAGDTITFAVAGEASEGTIDSARFIINGTTRPEVTQKKDVGGTMMFFDEFTIPENITSFTVRAQLRHSSVGFF